MSHRSSRVMWSAVIIGPFTPRKLTYCQEKRTLTHAGIKAFSLSGPRYPLVSETWYSSAHAFFPILSGSRSFAKTCLAGEGGGRVYLRGNTFLCDPPTATTPCAGNRGDQGNFLASWYFMKTESFWGLTDLCETQTRCNELDGWTDKRQKQDTE